MVKAAIVNGLCWYAAPIAAPVMPIIPEFSGVTTDGVIIGDDSTGAGTVFSS